MHINQCWVIGAPSARPPRRPPLLHTVWVHPHACMHVVPAAVQEKYYDLLAARNPVHAKTSGDGEVLLVGAQLRQVSALEQVVELMQVMIGHDSRQSRVMTRACAHAHAHTHAVHGKGQCRCNDATRADGAVPSSAAQRLGGRACAPWRRDPRGHSHA